MPFYVYSVKLIDGETKLTQVSGISLGGKNGSLYKHVRTLVKHETANDLRWELEQTDILRITNYENVENYRLIIDLKPKVKGNVSLFELRKIWGISYEEWTNLAVQLYPLYVDERMQDPALFKKEFKMPPENKQLVHEFLYTQWGFAKYNGGWGQVGSVNGALLWPDAFTYFVEKIQSELKK